jgi:hypothetical protein
MDTTITLRRSKHPNGCYDTEFSYQDYDTTFTLSDGDLDSSAGDLEQWCVVEYSEIPKVIKLLDSKFGLSDGDYTDDQKKYFDEIKNEDVKKLFPYIVDYCEKHNGSMNRFEQLLKEHNIEFDHSAYRSGSW